MVNSCLIQSISSLGENCIFYFAFVLQGREHDTVLRFFWKNKGGHFTCFKFPAKKKVLFLRKVKKTFFHLQWETREVMRLILKYEFIQTETYIFFKVHVHRLERLPKMDVWVGNKQKIIFFKHLILCFFFFFFGINSSIFLIPVNCFGIHVYQNQPFPSC